MADNPQTPQVEDEQIFYNVLPAERSSGPLTTLGSPGEGSVSSPNVSSRAGGRLPAWLSRRLIFIVVGGVIVLVIIGFVIYWLLGSEPEPEAPVNTTPTQQTDPEPITPQQPEGVTTPDDWQKRFFGNEICQNTTVCGDESDPDRDGLTNIDEFNATTDPNNPDSSGGGLADGDKVHIFGGDPLKVKSTDSPYTDAEYAQYGYSLTTNQPFTPLELADIKDKIKQYGLHQPTIATLGEEALQIYDFTSPEQASSTEALQGFDLSAAAQLDRDTQRLNTIKKIGAALLQYYTQSSKFPETTVFNDMVTAIRPFVTVATNFSDPVNKDKYIYGYIADNTAGDFTLTYFSETQNLLIKYKAQNAKDDGAKATSSTNDNQRTQDLDNLRTALLLYSSHNVDSNSLQQYVFPPSDQYKTALVSGNYISQIPTDPVTKNDYEYQVGPKFDTFTLKAVLDNPSAGTTGIMCNQEECRTY